jgi:putative membrane-bound dehydrogenase-like protein
MNHPSKMCSGPTRPILPCWLPTLLFLSASLSGAQEFQAGAAKIDITPEDPIRLSGYGSRTAVSEGIEDRLFARALVIKDSSGILTVLASVDVLGIPNWLREEVVGEIRGRTGIYHVRLALCATHTHYAPCVTGVARNIVAMTPEETSVVRAYTGGLIQKLVKAIDGALSKLSPASIAYGKGTAGFAKNRRTQGGPVDQDLPVLLVKDGSQKPIAIVFNYACHATTMPGEFNRISPDWPGYAAQYLEDAHAGAIALSLIGCGADANPDPRGLLSQAKEHGREIFTAVERVLAGPLSSLPARTDAQFEFLPIRFVKLPTEEELKQRLTGAASHIQRHARLQLDRIAQEGRLPETYPYPVQVLSFGSDLFMVFLGGEVVVDYSIRLHQEFPGKNLWITSYANDVPAYIASRRVLKEGGYEADDSMYWYGQPARWDDSVEDTIIAKVRALMPEGADSALARIKPPPALSPREALSTFRLPDDLNIELAAAEPEVTDPVEIAFDEKGRMYAAEMRDYPLGPGEGKPFDGRVRLLEDADLDGYFERSTVFAENLPYANGIACAKGGVFVTAVPNVLFLKDTDGDGRADVRQIVYTGFKPGNSQHLVNTLSRGLDNWIYANGGDLAAIHCVADPSVPDLQLVETNFRFDPLTLRVEAVSGFRGGFGITFNEFGERFVCDNQTHIVHVVLPRECLARNPDLRVDQTMSEPTNHGARIYPASKVMERFNDPQDYGRFSSSCGVHIYLGDALPGKYRGSHFVCEPVSNLVHRDELEPTGATFEAHRGEEDKEFLTSTDHWFRPVNCATGPDGALYIVDMYREVIEHPEWIPEHIQKYFDLRSGMDRGRIYRIIGRPIPGKSVDLTKASAEELLRGLGNANSWWRSTAQRLLVERADPASVQGVESVLRQSKNPLARLHALWTLEGLKALRAESLRVALDDPYFSVRAAGAALAWRFLDAGKKLPATEAEAAPLRDRLIRLAGDPDVRVRFQAAFSLAAIDPQARAEPLSKIALQDAQDPWARTAVLASSSDCLIPLLSALVKAGNMDGGRAQLIQQACNILGTRKSPKEVLITLHSLTEGLDEAGKGEEWRIEAASSLLEPLGHGVLTRILEAGAHEASRDVPLDSVRKKLSALFAAMAARAKDDSADLANRCKAVELVSYDDSPEILPLLKAFLDARYPLDLQAAAVRGLARIPRAEVAVLLIKAFPDLTPRVRGEVLDALLREPERTEALLKALEAKEIRPNDVDLTRRRSLLESGDESVRERAKKAFAEIAVDPNRAALVESYRKAFASPELSGEPDLRAGEELFLKNCAICHRVSDKGVPVGADLSGMRSREVDAMLVDILDPSRAVAPEFINYVLITNEGQVLNGLLASETSVNVVLRRAEGKTDSVLRRDIKELHATHQSVMPEGLEQQLSPKQLRDVIAYVRGGFEKLRSQPRAVQGGAGDAAPAPKALKKSLTFHASFDHGPNADLAFGDHKVYTGEELGKNGEPGLSGGTVSIAKGKGRFGDALEFRKKEHPVVFFRALENVQFKRNNWSGAVSLWLSLDPDKDLEPGFCDPIQITERGWNDGAFFVDFTKDDVPRHLRLGIFADRKVWDPKERDWNAVPVTERPMVDVARPPFGKGKWTHVLFTFASFNTEKDDGVAKLYLNGELQGALKGRKQTFTWNEQKAVIQLGISYIGLLDDFAIFDRELSDAEVKEVYRLEGGVKDLWK